MSVQELLINYFLSSILKCDMVFDVHHVSFQLRNLGFGDEFLEISAVRYFSWRERLFRPLFEVLDVEHGLKHFSLVDCVLGHSLLQVFQRRKSD